jgi:flagellar hook-associated protein 1 FlgK
MSITNSLSNAVSGLTATGKLADIASVNLANALTKGYARKSVELGSLILQGDGSGVSVRGITRASSPDLTAARRQADGNAAGSDALAQGLARLGQILGEATEEDGLFRRVEQVESALRLLADTPESAPRQTQAVDALKDLTDTFNRISQEAAEVRQNADKTISQQVDTVNTNLRQIEELNRRVQRLSAGGRDVTDLVNQRELLIDEVNAIIPTRSHPRDTGAVHLTTAQGLFLVSETAAQLEFNSSPVITTAMIYDPAGGGALSGLTLHGLDITPTSNHPQAIEEGSLFGEFSVRDQSAPTLLAQVDQLAANLIQRFENPTVDPTLALGDPGLLTDGGSAFDAANVDGLSGRISINALIDPDQSGDPARLRDGLQAAGAGPVTSDVIVRSYLDALTSGQSAAAVPGLDGSLSAAQTVSGIVEFSGIKRSDAETEISLLTALRETLANSEAEQIGVNSDEELQSLIQIEQAFAANVQVIQAASRMFEEILEIR